MRQLIVPAVVVSVVTLASAAPVYRVTDLHTNGTTDLAADGTVYVELASGINVKEYTVRGNQWAAVKLPADTTSVTDVSDHGNVLAYSRSIGLFVQTPAGSRRVLQPVPYGSTGTTALHVNDHSLVTGGTWFAGPQSLVTWPGHVPTFSHTPLGGGGAVNNLGTIVLGQAARYGRTIALDENGKIVPLAGPTHGTSYGNDINDHNQVAGMVAGVTSPGYYGAIWGPQGFTRVDPPAGSSHLEFNAINDAGVAVGDASMDAPTTADGNHFGAVLWTGKSLIDLNTMIDPKSGVHLWSARDINDAGQILAWGQAGGRYGQYLLTPTKTAFARAAVMSLSFTAQPVPEPTAASGMVAGLLLLQRRRRAVSSRGAN